MDVTRETFEHDVIARSHELPVVVDFWAEQCSPCGLLGPAIESEVAKRAGRVELAKVDVHRERELAGRYGIMSVPTVAVFRHGEPLRGFGFVGAYPQATIGRFIEEVLAEERASA